MGKTINAYKNLFPEADDMLQIYERRQVQTRVIALPWQFDCRTRAALQAQILAAPDRGSQHVILNFANVIEINSTELHDFFLWYFDLKDHHLTISVVKPPPYLRYHEDWTHLAEIVSIYRSLDDVDDVMEQRQTDV
jgi:hypothetical protein